MLSKMDITALYSFLLTTIIILEFNNYSSILHDCAYRLQISMNTLKQRNSEKINEVFQIIVHLGLAFILINVYRTTNGILETCADNLTDLQNHVKETELQTTKTIEILRQSSEQKSAEQLSPVKPKQVEDINARGFWNGEKAKANHIFDAQLSTALMSFFISQNASSLLDLGAGMGHYSSEAMKLKIFTSCYDGNPNTQELSDGRCATVDLSKPIHFTKHDWVLSLEVGEHIPKEYESIFMNNLDRVNKRGFVLSWGIENQGGHGHVNNRNNSYIIEKFENMGYKSDQKTQKILRDASRMSWFKNTIMVFTKN